MFPHLHQLSNAHLASFVRRGARLWRESPWKKTLRQRTSCQGMLWLVVWLGFVACGGDIVRGQQEVGFIERFALAEDRRAALAELIPGTQDYYYFHVLHYQNEGELADAQAMLSDWRNRLQDEPTLRNMELRQRLLNYSNNPQATLQYLREQLGVDLTHRAPIEDRAAILPTKLDNAALATDRLLAEALQRDRNFSEIETGYLPLVLDGGDDLSAEQLRGLLARLSRADLEQLVPLIAKELKLRDSQGFGWAAVHRELTLEQFEQLLKLMPELLENENFVRVYASRLLPVAGEPLSDRAVMREYLLRLKEWTDRLPPSQNNFKGLVLANLLRLEASQGRYSRELFVEYLALPRATPYYNPLRLKENRLPLVQSDFRLREVPLPPISDDDDLVRRYLEHFLQSDDNLQPFAPYLAREYLDRVLAETKILYGLGDASVWYAKLSPAEQKALRDRIELRFAPENETQYRPDQFPVLELELKNVDQLIIKVYEINTLNYYRKHGQPIDTTLDLDGLVANIERKLEFAQPADRRHRQQITFPELAGRGVWVVDLLGGGKRSRALIQKGQLRILEYATAAGQVVEVVDEAGKRLESAHVELNGRTYRPSQAGQIVLPYAEQLATRQLILVDGDFAVAASIAHLPEQYALQASFFVDRQALVAGTEAQLLVRPRLSCNGQPVPASLLRDPRLTITATDLDDIETSQSIGDIQLSDSEELLHEFLVPQRLSKLRFELTGKVFNHSQDSEQELSAGDELTTGGIAWSLQIGDFHLRNTPNGYRLLVLGRNGEPLSRFPLQVAVKPKAFTAIKYFKLATGDDGNLALGELANVERITVDAAGLQSASFELNQVHRAWPKQIQLGSDRAIELPLGTDRASLEDFSLFSLRGPYPLANAIDRVELLDGSLRIAGLPPGNYRLQDHQRNQQVVIAIADAEGENGFAMAKHRALQTERRVPVVIRSAKPVGGNLVVTVDHADEHTRLHVIGEPLYPEEQAARRLQVPEYPLAERTYPAVRSYYVDSLQLDEEYRYILERQAATKYPGNMLPQPSVLLHPWEVSVTENAVQMAAPGAAMPSMAAPEGAMDSARAARDELRRQGRSEWPLFDFLASGAEIAGNLAVDDGRVVIALEQLANFSQVQIVVVHPTSLDSRTVVLPAGELKTRDLRLEKAFDEQEHLAQVQKVELFKAGQRAVLGDARTRRLQTYSSLSDVFQLYATLLNNSKWEEFRFLTRWGALEESEKQRLYGRYACHEVNFFLYHKDRAFFDRVVGPSIAQKLDKQLVDQWLLGNSLEEFGELWKLQRLNTLERVLLAERVESLQAGTSRWLQNYVDANPLDPRWRQTRFEASLRGKQLDASELGLGQGFFGGMGGGGMGGMGGYGGEAEALADKGDSQAPRRLKSMPRNRGSSRGAAEAMEEPSADFFGSVAPQSPMAGGRDRLFRSLDKTREWAESNYYRLRIGEQTADVIPRNVFWNEFLQRGSQPFLSEQIDIPVSNIHEALCALAVIDLPFDGKSPTMTVAEDNQLVVESATPSIAFVESIEVRETADEAADDGSRSSSILVGQDIYLAQPGTADDANQPLQGALLSGVPYQANVVVTNPTNSRVTVHVLTQLPAGSLPLGGSKLTRSHALELQPYSTQNVAYQFYFPQPGLFAHYGAQVSSATEFLTAARSRQYQVLAEPESVDQTTWSYVADWGTDAQVLDFLGTANLQQIELSRIAFRMQDRDFFAAVTELLSAGGQFVPAIWGYAFVHDMPQQIEQYLQNRPDFVSRLGMVFRSELINVAVDEQLSYEHLEYRPLVAARAHRLGATNKIMNPSMHAQYHRLLTVIAHQPRVASDQHLPLAYYLLLQNRLTEALAWFDRVDAAELDTPLVHDYFTAYFDFYRGEFERGAELASRYVDHPLPRWQSLFEQVVQQHRQRQALLAGEQGVESEGLPTKPLTAEQRRLVGEREARQNAAAVTSPRLELTMSDGRLMLKHQHVDAVRVNYYLMDIELLFSRNPFVIRGDDSVPVIEPNASRVVEFGAGEGTAVEIMIPDEIRHRNVLVETTADGISRSVVVTPSTLTLEVVEPMGWLQVRSAADRRPVVGAYVKVYAQKQDGSSQFFKDGYTDLRGQFDYATLSTSDLDDVRRFAILVLDAELGASVREAAPPTR